MKKTFTINISGTIFHIEEDAYEKLQDYLQKLKLHFGNGPESAEIIADIEGRIAEIFIEKTRADNKIITIGMIDDVIGIMGRPEDFTENNIEEEPLQSSPTSKNQRRLYRNGNNRVIAGVCSGLGAYFKIEPVLLRIIFVLLIFANGVGLLAYFILWIAVPKARTAAQLLEMRGEEVNVSNIERTVRDQTPGAASQEYRTFAETGETVTGSEQPYRYEQHKRESDASSDMGKRLLSAIGVVFGIFFMITGFMGLAGIISSAIVGQSLVGSWPLAWSPDPEISTFFNQFVSSESISLGILALALLTGIPLLALFWVGTKLVFRYKTNNAAIIFGLIGLWLMALLTLVVVSVGEAGNYKSHTSLSNSETVYCANCPVIYIESAPDPYSGYAETDWDNNRFKLIHKDGENLLLGQPRFDIEKSNGNEIVLQFKKQSRGKNQTDVNNKIREITYNHQVKDSLLILDPWFLTGSKGQWRDQKVDIILKLPVGKTIYLSENMGELIRNIDNISHKWGNEMAGNYWKMLPEGLKLVEELPAESSEQIIN